MSSKSENGQPKAEQEDQQKPLKQPAQNPPPEKRTRSKRKKNAESSEEFALPSEIPLSDSPEVMFFHSIEQETTKVILQVPLALYASNNISQENTTRVQSNIISIRLKLADPDTIVVEAKLNNGKQPKVISLDPPAEGQSVYSSEEEKVMIVWGRSCWVGNRQVFTKTNKQVYKTLNETFSQIQKIKLKEVMSDIFISVQMKKKLDCVSDYNGLINQGNTCYMNSYLQMLNHISEFKNLVFEAEMFDENKFPASLQILFYRLAHDQKPVSAEQLVKSFGWSKKEAQIQQDAQEFSCLFFQVLERKLNEACSESNHMSMGSLFWGKLQHKIACLHVDYGSVKVETFIDLQLDLQKNLETALDNYVSEQLLSGDNMYSTDFFGKQEALKSVRIQQLPPILMIQLKRFQFSPVTFNNEKILDHFEYPNEIDFSKWMVHQDPDHSFMYELYGVLVHEGIKAESGHYYVYLKVDGQWYKFNDQEVSLATKEQVFEYNFGGEIEVLDLDTREAKIRNRIVTKSSTAYMLVYVKKQMVDQLLNCDVLYPKWLKDRELVKQEEKEEMKARKNFYNDIESLHWDKHLRGTSANYLGLLPRNEIEIEFQPIERLPKQQKIQEWVKPYNQKELGAYFYLTSSEKAEYESLVNLQHRKSTFQEVLKDPSCPITILFTPVIAKADNYLIFVKLLSVIEGKIDISFDHCFQFSRSSNEADLFKFLSRRYDQEGFTTKFYYEEKKQLSGIRKETNLVRGSLTARNVLIVLIVEKIPNDLTQKYPNPTRKWYAALKNNIDLILRSEQNQLEKEIQIDQNTSVSKLRTYIFEELVKNDDAYGSAENIVLKGKLKKSSKNFMEITEAKTIKDLIKNCEREKIIQFCSSSLKTEQRVDQMEIKFQYRFKDFSLSDTFHVVLDKNSENASEGIYKKIVQHPEVEKFLQIENCQRIQMLLFTKDRLVINDMVSSKGHVIGKGEVGLVLQKEKGSQLIVEGCFNEQPGNSVYSVLLHHKTHTGDRVGTPRYLEFSKDIRLVDLHSQLIDLLLNQQFEWEEKLYPFNPMKLYIWAYGKDANKGIEIVDQETALQEMKKQTAQKKETKDEEKKETKKKKEADEDKSGNINEEESISEESVEEVFMSQTIEQTFPKVRVVRIVIHHQYLTKAQNRLKINVE